MAFVEIQTAEDIFDVLEADQVFSGLIGSITFDDGSTTPGLVVSLASDPLVGLDQAQGLLVVIEKDPQYKSQRLLTAQVVIDRMFSIRLLQFGGTARVLRPAIERLLEIFPGSSAIPLATPDEIAGDGQAVFKLPSNPVAHV